MNDNDHVNKMTHAKFHLVNVEPYTSELYSNLLEPAFTTIEDNYNKYGKKPITRENLYKGLCIAPIKGCLFGVWRSLFTVAWKNINHEYEKQDPKPPIDIFFIKYYTNPRNFPVMFRGLRAEMKVEVMFQMCRCSLGTFAKYLVPSKSDSFLTNVGISFGRAFTANLISASTVYPLSLNYVSKLDTDQIVKKAINRAGRGSLKTATFAVGLQIARSIMPSYRKLLKFQSALLGVL